MPKLCEDLVVGREETSKQHKAKSKCRCKKGDEGYKKTDCTSKRKATKKTTQKSVKGKNIQREEKGKGPTKEEKRNMSVLAHINNLMSELQEQKRKLKMKALHSPKESSKGHKRRNEHPIAVKVKHVGRKKG